MRLRKIAPHLATASVAASLLAACSNSSLSGGGKSANRGQTDTHSEGGPTNNQDPHDPQKIVVADSPAAQGQISTSAFPGETAVDIGSGSSHGGSPGDTANNGDGSAAHVFTDGGGTRRELFDFGANSTTPVADYLFV